jgi:hypothetical protein
MGPNRRAQERERAAARAAEEAKRAEAERQTAADAPPRTGVATKLRALKPDSWWPQVARGDIDKDFPSFSFNLDLFTRPVDIGGLALTGRLQRTEKGIGGVFSVASAGRPPARIIAAEVGTCRDQV